MKKQITLAFATLFVLVGVFSASSGPATKPTQGTYMSPVPAPICDPGDPNCRPWPR